MDTAVHILHSSINIFAIEKVKPKQNYLRHLPTFVLETKDDIQL